MPEKAASRSPLTSKNERLRVRYDLHTKICTQIKENKEMDAELKNFLTRIYAGPEVLDRLATTGAKTLEEAWARADARDLIWAVTRPGVMSPEQRRKFLAEAVLAPIEHLLTDERSKNIIQKLRTNEQITDADRLSAAYAADADAANAWYATRSAYWAAGAAQDSAWSVWAACAAEDSVEASSFYEASLDKKDRYAWEAQDKCNRSADAAREAQAKWIRDNFVLNELNIK